MALARATRRGMIRVSQAATSLTPCTNSVPNPISKAAGSTAMAATNQGCRASTGGMPMTARVEFCQPVENHRKVMASTRQASATIRPIHRARRGLGQRSSR